MKGDTIVAKVRATAKGKTLRKNHTGRSMGVKGRDGRKWYNIYQVKQNGGFACSCPAYIFSRGVVGERKHCKHIEKLLHDVEYDCVDPREIHITDPFCFLPIAGRKAKAVA